MDRISALSDDLLHLVLGRLGCVRTAARTSLLSRRWRGLWFRLSRLVFRGVAFRRLEPVLARVSCPAVSLLDIRVPKYGSLTRLSRQQHAAGAASVGSLLRAAARLSPDEFVLTVPTLLPGCGWDVDLPSFDRAASIKLDVVHLLLELPAETQFPALETLCLSGCFIQVATLVPRCPRLRVLRVKLPSHGLDYDITVHSPTLEELAVESEKISRIDIVAPELKHLALCFYPHQMSEFSVSISAPRLERVSWECKFICPILGLGHWHLQLQRLSLRPAESYQLHIDAAYGPYKVPYEGHYEGLFSQGMEKLLFADFSALELHLTTMGHVFGGFVMHLLGMHKIRCGVQKLKIVLTRSKERENACLANGCCDEPGSWKTQSIFLTGLQEVEIDGLKGEDHELDILKLIFMCAPELKRMTLKLWHEHSPSNHVCTQVRDIFKAYPYVESSYVVSTPFVVEKASIVDQANTAWRRRKARVQRKHSSLSKDSKEAFKSTRKHRVPKPNPRVSGPMWSN